MKAIRQMIRGCTDLPHVGPHPGTEFLVMFIVMGAIAGASRGQWRGVLFGAGFMAVFVVPLYLSGAYSRAETSDRMEGKGK